MAQVDSENTTAMPVDPTRRRFITIAAGASVASVGSLAAVAMPATAGLAEPDPIFAAIDAFHRADAAVVAVDGDIPDKLGDQCHEAYLAVIRTRPVTPAGLAALTGWVRERTDWLCANSSTLPDEEQRAIAAAIDDATRGMSGLEPWSPPPPAAATHNAQTLDAELIELGARFEPVVDQYYVARKRWARSLESAHAEHDQAFGTPAERNYQYPPEIVAAFEGSCERSGANEADDALSAVHEEMKHLAKAINASPVNSIEGLRAKALVAFFEVAPLCADQTEFSFDDAYPFQQLFTAVAELCGLKDKIAATGYELPDISDDDPEDEEGEA